MKVMMEQNAITSTQYLKLSAEASSRFETLMKQNAKISSHTANRMDNIGLLWEL